MVEQLVEVTRTDLVEVIAMIVVLPRSNEMPSIALADTAYLVVAFVDSVQ